MSETDLSDPEGFLLARWKVLMSAKYPGKSLHADQVRALSPAALAYLGDAVFELYVRSCYLIPPQRIHQFHQQVVAQVRAEQQSEHLEILKPYLTNDELDLLRRGRNAAAHRRSRASGQAYQQASALETLVGYLYLTDPDRLLMLLAYLPLHVH